MTATLVDRDPVLQAFAGEVGVDDRIAARGADGQGGGRLTAEMVIARNLLRDIELFLPIVFLAQAGASGGDMGAAGIASVAWFLIFALFPCFNRDRLRAGDLIAGTVWLLALNLAASPLGLHVGWNPVSALIAGSLGLPGVAALLVLAATAARLP